VWEPLVTPAFLLEGDPEAEDLVEELVGMEAPQMIQMVVAELLLEQGPCEEHKDLVEVERQA